MFRRHLAIGKDVTAINEPTETLCRGEQIGKQLHQ